MTTSYDQAQWHRSPAAGRTTWDQEILRTARRYGRELGNFRRSMVLFHAAFLCAIVILLAGMGMALADPAPVAAAGDSWMVRLSPQVQAHAQAMAAKSDPRVAFVMLLSLFVVTAGLAGLFWRRLAAAGRAPLEALDEDGLYRLADGEILPHRKRPS